MPSLILTRAIEQGAVSFALSPCSPHNINKLKRRLLIFAAYSATEDFRLQHSMRNDANCYKNFFSSVEGGSWCDSEITCLIGTQASKQAILDAIKRTVCDFLIVIFIGHGCVVAEINEQYVGDCDGKFIAIDELVASHCQKQLFFVDACSAYMGQAITSNKDNNLRIPYVEPIDRTVERSLGVALQVNVRGDVRSAGDFHQAALLEPLGDGSADPVRALDVGGVYHRA